MDTALETATYAQQLNVKIATSIAREIRKKAFLFKKFTDIISSGYLSEMWKMKNYLIPRKFSKVALKKVTKQFTIHELENVLKGLKINKARDPQGLSRILFRNSILGINLKHPLLKMLNTIKNLGIFPQFRQEATVITIPQKGSKLLWKN